MIRCEYFDSNAGDTSLISKFVGKSCCSRITSRWRALKYFLAFMMIFSFGIAIAFLFLGYWLVLPFTGLEMGVLELVPLAVFVCGNLQEVITFSRRGATGNRYRRSGSYGDLGALFHEDSRYSSRTSVVPKDRSAGAPGR